MTIHIVGLGMDVEALPDTHQATIDNALVLVGGKRQLECFEEHPARKILISAPLSNVYDEIRACEDKDDIVVLADGDPMLFSIGNTLVREMPEEDIRVLPNVSAMQVAAARLAIPLQDIKAVSLHGRKDFTPLYDAIMSHDWVAIYTDSGGSPAAIAQALLDRGAENWALWVLEDLEGSEESIRRYELSEIRTSHTFHLNLVILEKTGPGPERLHPGIDDSLFEASGRVMTKWPVRAVGVAALGVRPGDVVWDLGAGSGAMSVEMAAAMRRGRIIALERSAERVAMIRTNAARFGAYIVEADHRVLPDGLDELPEPDRIFIGGGLGRSIDLLDHAYRCLATGGTMVIHCVLLSTLCRIKEWMDVREIEYRLTQISANHGSELAGDVRLEASNPVFILAFNKT